MDQQHFNNYYGYTPKSSADIYAAASPFLPPAPYPHYASHPPPAREDGVSALPGGTLLHKGFYDLLALIPSTATASRFLWGEPQQKIEEQTVAGPKYEDISPRSPTRPGPGLPTPGSPNASPRKGRRLSKDMVSKPMNFVHLVHASDADQAEALLSRWGPDGMGKIGDPRWAGPIKLRVRQHVQAKAVNEVVNALNPSLSSDASVLKAPLRVMNGMSTPTASTITTAATAGTQISSRPSPVEGLPRNSTLRAMGGLKTHPEHEDEDDPTIGEKEMPEIPQQRTPRAISPSLQTLEKAVAAKIYFENLYFPLLRHPPSREQRRLAMEREMEEMRLSEDRKAELRRRWRQNETEYLRDRRRKVDVSTFVTLKTIGHGAFGVVSLVREKTTGQLCAMKQLRKTDMLRKGQEGHVRAERDVLKSASLVNNPGGAEWIVRLFYSFQDRDHLYLVLEYMGGGDLLNLLIEKDVFEEDFARFYIAEMVLAIESCHKLGFIHRDIKPDNFLFDPQGHIKLSDFGLATDLHWAHDTSYYEQQRRDLLHKYGIDLDDGNGSSDGTKTKRLDRKEVNRLMSGENGEGIFTWREKNRKKLAYSVCGTNSYMSPEVIRGHGYTFSCDWWSLGVIMFECLYGFPPFVSNSRHVTRQKILNWKQSLKFPARPRVSHEGINLMQQLLCEPEDRLGSQASSSVSRPNSMVVQARRSGFILPDMRAGKSVDGAEHIKAHPWFRGIDWANIHRYPAPFRPELQNPEDTRHFDDDIPAEPLAPANGAPPDATKDPLLRDKVHGAEILNVRKALAFAGFTHKSPRAITYLRADHAFGENLSNDDAGEDRGRSTVRETRSILRSRAMSL
ncbi:kinase-like protein [Fomitiporia mediterranea MF3/22]|uniref:kinase-like protein n=1 Tax=Fomitiporia mediterranea (strain MF3/22) TaxID=694068 RepID=UPI0004408C83|nr:kinase-like protein [Fomitiporia mediterranea MF3/22]EJD03128.1 kinase-like protein [Fomitiporia mediterranea MF3/22]